MGKDPVDLPAMRKASHARDHRMFAGKLDRKSLSRPQRAALLVFRGLDGTSATGRRSGSGPTVSQPSSCSPVPLSSSGGSDVCFGVSRPGRCCPGSSPGARSGQQHPCPERVDDPVVPRIMDPGTLAESVDRPAASVWYSEMAQMTTRTTMPAVAATMPARNGACARSA
jgi:hypothetical protein